MSAFSVFKKECGGIAKSAKMPVAESFFGTKHLLVFLFVFQHLEGFFGEDGEVLLLLVFEELQ